MSNIVVRPKIDDILKKNFTAITPDYEKFAREKDACRRCPIYANYIQNAQSEGNAKNPTFMFIGEAYGKDEQEQVRPFIGRAGQRLRQELRKWSKVFDKENTILTNVLSCRPYSNKFPVSLKTEIWPSGNREQSIITNDVASYCQGLWLDREIALLRPKVIVALGAVALKYVFGVEKISEHRGEWRFLLKYRAMGFSTYHPSYILRCANDHAKSYNVKLFEQDIAKIATTWQKMIVSDFRMRLSDEDYQKQMAIEKVKAKFKGTNLFYTGIPDD